MLSENITVSIAELNSGSEVIKLITDYELPAPQMGKRHYRPSSIVISNYTGDTIGYNLFTEGEYTNWVANNTISDYIPIANGYEDNIDNSREEITRIVIQGLGTHNADLTITVIKEFS